jgi:hypothetical protein
MDKFKRDTCEVCGEPVVDVSKLPPELREKVYRPGVEEAQNVEVDLSPPSSFDGNSKPLSIDVEIEE